MPLSSPHADCRRAPGHPWKESPMSWTGLGGGVLGLPPLLRLLWVALLFHPTSTFILWYFSPNPAFPNLLVPWNYIIFLLGSVPVLLGRGIVTLSGKTPRLASVEAAVASAWSHKGNAALHRPRCSCLSQRADGATFVCGGSQTFFLLSLLVCAPQGVVGPPRCDRTDQQPGMTFTWAPWISLPRHIPPDSGHCYRGESESPCTHPPT